jgi:ornithine cyclodeaminase
MSSSAAPQSPVFLDAGAIARHLPWPALIDALAEAFRCGVTAPPRDHHALDPATGAVLLVMPAWSAALGVGTKLVTVFPRNGERGLPSIHGVYVLIDAATGRPLAVLDGGELTARRTAAASALASRFLSRTDSRMLLMIGTGRLARYLPPAHAAVRPIERVLVWGRSPARAEAAAADLRGAGLAASVIADVEAAAAEADIVSCATLARAPLFSGAKLRPGAHVDLVGAFTPTMREADDATLARATAVWTDTLDSALAEGGDLVQALASGALARERVRGGLAELCRAGAPPPRGGNDITVYKSVGAAIEDLAAAHLCLSRYAC